MRSEPCGVDSGVLFWLNEDELSSIPSSVFWNDEELEKSKPFYLVDGNPERLLRYLRETTSYYDQYDAVLKFACDLGLNIQGTGVDVAAGVCWTTALLSRMETIERLYAVDLSKHRLLKLAPLVCDALGAAHSKIVRALGSFYNINLPDKAVDFCVMSQAFHHADDVRRLLAEQNRLLKSGAPILILGETPIFPSQLLKQRLKNVIKMVLPPSFYNSKPVYKLIPTFEDLFPVDLRSGDHYYRLRDYERIFEEAGFELYRRRVQGDTVFVAVRN